MFFVSLVSWFVCFSLISGPSFAFHIYPSRFFFRLHFFGALNDGFAEGRQREATDNLLSSSHLPLPTTFLHPVQSGQERSTRSGLDLAPSTSLIVLKQKEGRPTETEQLAPALFR